MDSTHPDSAAPAPRAPTDPLHPLRTLGPFRVLRLLGEGGMGFVYLGYDATQDRQVALKVLADSLASNQSFIDRFYREARHGNLLNHSNIVRSYGAAQDRETFKHYLVLEYVDGINTRDLLSQRKCLNVGDAVHIALDIARALEHAHSRNVIHRDIKPDNILITRSGVAKLADMGLARRTDETSNLTAVRQGFGTPHYMPYEQAVNAKYADGRSDIYALGATLYHLLTGDVPFSGANHLEVVEKKNLGVFLPASALNSEVPPLLDEILDKMLARDPRDRYQTSSELIIDLERSRLASPVLSFADHELALQDPAARSYLSTAGERTLPDLLNPGLVPGVTPPVIWYLRYRGKDGAWRKVRATETQIARRVREGRMPAEAEACREGEGAFRALGAIPQFRPHFKRRRPAVRRKPRPTKPSELPPPPPSARPWLWLGLGAVGLALFAFGLFLLSRV